MLEAVRSEYTDDRVQGEGLRILEPGNESLQDLVDKFGKIKSQLSKAQIACFYELKTSCIKAIIGGRVITVRLFQFNSYMFWLSSDAEFCGK